MGGAHQRGVGGGGASNQGVFFGGAGALAVAGLALLLVRCGKRRSRRRRSANEVPEPSTPCRSARPRETAGLGRPAPGTARASARSVAGRAARSGVALTGAAGTARARRRRSRHHGLPTMPDTQVDAAAACRCVVPINGETSKLFGRYRVLEQLGVGGMSEVYTAVAHGAEGFSRTFVIKRLRPELARNKEAVAQFIDEARVQASLVHSNIVPVFDFGMMGGEYFMIEEYILGRDLARVSTRCVERTGFRLEPRLVYYFVYETLQALALRPQQAGAGRRAAGHRPPGRLGHQHHVVLVGRGEAVRLRHRQGQHAAAPRPRPAWSRATPTSCRPSRPGASRWTSAATCSRWPW